MDPVTMSALAGFGSSALDAVGGGGAAPGFATSGNSPVTVSVGGLNVPAFPNFPRMEMGQRAMTQTPVFNQMAANSQVYWVAGGLVAVFLLMKLRK